MYSGHATSPYGSNVQRRTRLMPHLSTVEVCIKEYNTSLHGNSYTYLFQDSLFCKMLASLLVAGLLAAGINAQSPLYSKPTFLFKIEYLYSVHLLRTVQWHVLEWRCVSVAEVHLLFGSLTSESFSYHMRCRLHLRM